MPASPAKIFMILNRGNYVFLGLVALYLLICWRLSAAHGLEDSFHPVFYLDTGMVMTLSLAAFYGLGLALRAYYIMIFIRPERLTAYLWQEFRSGPLRAERFLRALPLFIGMVFFLSAFTSMKQIIPGIHPFTWDETLLRWDRAIHFGIDPWRLLQPLLGYAPVTWAVNLIYNLWLPALFVALYWQALSLRSLQIRMQFFYSFILCWAINGTFLAIAFSSVGPCFLERLNGNDHFLPLMDYLNGVNERYGLFAIMTQNMVWESIAQKETMIGGGISAMPSVHVSTALLFLLTALKMKLRLWPCFAAFFAVILLGSVHLGWHYAVDGYLAILTTLGLWLLAGWLSRKMTSPEKS